MTKKEQVMEEALALVISEARVFICVGIDCVNGINESGGRNCNGGNGDCDKAIKGHYKSLAQRKVG